MGHGQSAAASAGPTCCSWLLLPVTAGLLSSRSSSARNATSCQERHAEWPRVPCALSVKAGRAQEHCGREVAKASQGAPGGLRSSDGSLWCSFGQRAFPGQGEHVRLMVERPARELGRSWGRADMWGTMGFASVSVGCAKTSRKRVGREALMSSTLAHGSSPRWALASCQEALGEELACPRLWSPSSASQSKLELAQGT